MSRIVHPLINRRFFRVAALAGIATFSYFLFLMPSISAQSLKGASASSQSGRVGSLALSDLNEDLLNQSPALQQQIQQALKQVNKDDVGCFAPLVYRPFDALNNARIAPFTCRFASNKTLTIQAKTFAKLPDGSLFPIEQLSDRKNTPEGASLEFKLTSWKWTNAKQ